MELKLKVNKATAGALMHGEVLPLELIDAVCEAASQPKHRFSWNGEQVLEIKDPNYGTPYPAREMENSVAYYTPSLWSLTKRTLTITFCLTSYSFYEK